MSTPVNICSNALLKLGSRSISSLDDNTDMALLCRNIYPEARDALLRSHLWNFAVKRANLASEVAAPAYQYGYSHVLPADYLRVIEVEDITDYALENGRILCDETPINIQYVAKVTDTSFYDTLFIELLTQKMVAELAYAVTKSDSKAQAEQKKFIAMLRQARSIDAMEQPGQQIESMPLIEARY